MRCSLAALVQVHQHAHALVINNVSHGPFAACFLHWPALRPIDQLAKAALSFNRCQSQHFKIAGIVVVATTASFTCDAT